MGERAIQLAKTDGNTKARQPAESDQTTSPYLSANAFTGGVVRRNLSCACGGGCPACQSNQPIQTKLTIGEANDEYEQEADRVADQVMAPQHNTLISTVAPHIQRLTGQAAGQMGFAPAGVAQTHSSLGSPLEPTLRLDMEQRFGSDFSQVRVHSGSIADQSARDVNAIAYTVGRDVVFGAGAFEPETRGGLWLLAHELTHVVQQRERAAHDCLQRKELRSSVMGMTGELLPQDWYHLHRVEWQHVSATGTEPTLSPNNTFMRAAWYNTLHLNAHEYQTVGERHDYYDLISYVIEHDPGTPKAARGVRFFHATTAVTGSPGIESVDKPIGQLKLGADARQILRDVNVELFSLNMRVIRDLLSNWKEPRDPENPGGRIGDFDFDIRMVETEQALVGDYIKQFSSRFTPTVVQEINATMDPNRFGQFFNFSRTSLEWAVKALGVSTLDFTLTDHRQAIGFAEVHFFHRKSLQDYLAFMKAKTPQSPPRSRNQLTVGNLSGATLNGGLSGPWQTFYLAPGTNVEVIDWSHMMGPYQVGDKYAGKVEVRVVDGMFPGTTGWLDYAALREPSHD